MAIRRLLVAGLLLLLVLPSVVSQGESEFACYASTDCHGATVESPPSRGECCAGKGLSFKPTQMDDCRNCFTEEEFVNAGSEFFLAFFNNLDLRFLSLANLKVRVGNLEESSQTVKVSSRLGESDRTVNALSFEEISIDKDLRTEGIEERNNAILVQSMEQGQLSVSALGDELTSSDTFHALPCVYLPSLYEYYVVSVQRSALTQSDGDDVFVAPPLGNSVFIVVASEGDTRVTLTLTQTVTVRPDIVAEEGVPMAVTLNRAETLFVSSEDSLTGSHIVSNKPIALFSGHECGTIPSRLRYCDQMVEQIPPTSTWGKEFYTVPMMTRTMDGFKVISARDDNVLRGACSSSDGTMVMSELSLSAGQEVDFNITSEYFCHFESDYPILLVQFSLASAIDNNRNADPFMTIVPPAKQYQNSYMVDHFQGASSGETFFLNIVILNDLEVDRNDLRLDGKPLDPDMQWTEIKCRSNLMATCASGIQLEMEDDETVRLSHPNSDARFVAVSYTLAFRTGRGSFSGMAQKPIALDTVTIGAPEYRVTEGSGEANIILNRTGDLLDDIIIPFRAHTIPDAANPAIPDEDFVEVEMNVTFPAGSNEMVVTVPLTRDDIFPEEDKVFEVYLGASPGVLISPTAYVNVTIENDDPPLPVMNISFSETLYSVSEGVGFINLTLVKTEGAVGPVAVSLFTVEGTAVEFGDFEPIEMNVTFDIDETQKNVEIVITNDEILEVEEDFFVIMEPVEGIFPLEVQDGLVSVLLSDNDVVVIGFQSSLESVDENGEAVSAIVEILHGKLNTSVQVTCRSVDGQASEGDDYFEIDRLLTFDNIRTEVPILVGVINDAIPEDREVFTLSLMNGDDSSVVIIPDQMTISIIDDDLVSLTLEGPDSVQESAGTVDVTVSVDTGDRSGQIRVGISTIPGTANAIEDFESIINREVQLGGEIQTQTISIGINNNDKYDDVDKTFTVQLTILESDFDNIMINSASVQIRILEDDERPLLDTECFIIDAPSEFVSSPEECCVNRAGSGYMSLSATLNYTIPCIVIGFAQTSYTYMESSDPEELAVEVVVGDLAMNLSITIIPEPDTATASDYTVSPWVVLRPGIPGIVDLTLVNEPDPNHMDLPMETFRLELMEQTGITPPNVFFRGASIDIIDASRIRS